MDWDLIVDVDGPLLSSALPFVLHLEDGKIFSSNLIIVLSYVWTRLFRMAVSSIKPTSGSDRWIYLRVDCFF